MEENRNNTPISEEDDDLKTITLKKYVWPDEAALRKEKKKNRTLKFVLAGSVVAAVLVGWLGGSVLPYGGTGGLRSALNSMRGLDSSDKIQQALDLMEDDWYFGKDVEDLSERLTDQAITGITTNDEDKHTEYMSADEMTAFTQSINRNYVGIGVQFINTEGTAIVDRIFKDSPAQDAGVQAGDIIKEVDGTDVTGMTSAEIKELVQGDAGTAVTIKFIRDGKTVALKIIRANVSATTYGKMMDNDIAYLQLYQFGDSTPAEVRAYLDDFKASGAKKLILDLRDNGGGYLDSVSSISACFLPKGSAVMKREYKTGKVTTITTDEDQYSDLSDIVILINQNTASAAEVLTLALREQRDDVTVEGVTSYGKGTVQVSRQFSDGSAIKYTTSKWLSPNGTWVNGEGIQPDEEVRLHDVFYHTFAGIKDEKSYTVDQVAEAVGDTQLSLDYLGYDVDRTDGYFSEATAEALRKFESEHNLEADAILNKETYAAVHSAVVLKWGTTEDTDSQLQRAEDILNGK